MRSVGSDAPCLSGTEHCGSPASCQWPIRGLTENGCEWWGISIFPWEREELLRVACAALLASVLESDVGCIYTSSYVSFTEALILILL